MALEAERIGTWKEFRRHVLPKIMSMPDTMPFN